MYTIEQEQSMPLGHSKKVLNFIVENKPYHNTDQYITGLEIKQLVGIPTDTDLYLSVAFPWEDELIQNDQKVDLARPGIEYFYVRKKLTFSINGQSFTWFKQYITGKQIRELGKIDEQDAIFLKIRRPFEDELINDQTKVDLARPGVEHFISVETPVLVSIIVNGSPKEWDKKTISFAELIKLVYGTYTDNGSTAYTVTYKRGPSKNPQGTMSRGDSVKVKDKMIFNVTPTDKS